MSFDGDLLRSVMENLVRNAHESYPDADGRCDVEVALLREKTSVVIAVRDRGKGIPPELLEKVFDPFFTDKVHGSGVGLSLSRRFVEAAGGHPHARRAKRRRHRGARHAARAERGVKVLIADDEKNIRDSVAAFIASEGMETSVAADGADARALLENEAFDCLILDLRMPKMDGLSLLAWLQEAGPPTPVIVISAYGDVRDAVQAMKLGAGTTWSSRSIPMSWSCGSVACSRKAPLPVRRRQDGAQ